MENKKRIDIVYILLVLITVIGLSVLLVLVNTKVISMSELERHLEEIDKSTSTTTTTVLIDETATIKVNEENVLIHIKKYNSLFGFSINYDKNYFNIKSLSDSSVEFVDKNSTSYLKISKINYDTYNEELNKDGIISINENIKSYITLKVIGNNYYRVTYDIDTNVYNDDTLESRFNYMILSLEEH